MTELKVFRSLLGKHKVSYQCPNCAERLRSTIAESRRIDQCPACRATFRIPGRNELVRIKEYAQQVASLEELEAQLSANLEILRRQTQNAHQLEKTRAEVLIAECHKRFEAFSTKAISGVVVDGNSARANAVIALGNMTAARISEVHAQDWPQALKEDAMDELLRIMQRVLDELNKEDQ